MIAGEKSVGSNGKQNFLFPLPYMYLSQGSYTATYSHNGCYAMDFIGWGENGRILNAPVYAPFDCTCVAIWGSNSPMVVWQSDDVVNYIDGDTIKTDICCIGFVHDDNTLSFHVGDTRKQGDIISHTGTYGADADHIHIEGKIGVYNGYHLNSYGVYMMTDSTWLYNLFGVNDTNMYKDYYVNHDNVRVDYHWRTFSDTPTPPTPIPSYSIKNNFKWVLYANKLRKQRS